MGVERPDLPEHKVFELCPKFIGSRRTNTTSLITATCTRQPNRTTHYLSLAGNLRHQRQSPRTAYPFYYLEKSLASYVHWLRSGPPRVVFPFWSRKRESGDPSYRR